MHAAWLVLLLCCWWAVFVQAKGTDNRTLGELALEQSVGKWDAVEKDLPSVNDKATPTDKGIASVRDGLEALRDLADIFVFTYPVGSAGGCFLRHLSHSLADIWPVMRKDFTDGYKFISHYSDLEAVNYTKAVQEQELANLLEVLFDCLLCSLAGVLLSLFGRAISS
jgi:hypothetical protein